jgi:hypothetical protein
MVGDPDRSYMALSNIGLRPLRTLLIGLLVIFFLGYQMAGPKLKRTDPHTIFALNTVM